jgi:hypothetical protein
MNSRSSLGTVPKCLAFQAALAYTTRSRLELTKFQKMNRGPVHRRPAQQQPGALRPRAQRQPVAAERLPRELPRKQGRAPRVMVTDELASHPAAKKELIPASGTASMKGSTTGRRTPASRHGDAGGR